MDPKSNEQWKLDGICKICRRQKYCDVGCSANKKHQESIIRGAVQDMFSQGIYGMIPEYGEERKYR